jgi:hypothetical protein
MTNEEIFAGKMSDLLYQMRTESMSDMICFDKTGRIIPKEYCEKTVDDPTDSRIMHGRIYDEILHNVTNFPELFATDEKGEFTYCPDTYDYANLIDSYIEEKYDKERQSRLQVRYKVWIEIERIEVDPLTGEDDYYDEEVPMGVAYRDTFLEAEELQNLISDTFGEV